MCVGVCGVCVCVCVVFVCVGGVCVCSNSATGWTVDGTQFDSRQWQGAFRQDVETG